MIALITLGAKILLQIMALFAKSQSQKDKINEIYNNLVVVAQEISSSADDRAATDGQIDEAISGWDNDENKS